MYERPSNYMLFENRLCIFCLYSYMNPSLYMLFLFDIRLSCIQYTLFLTQIPLKLDGFRQKDTWHFYKLQ